MVELKNSRQRHNQTIKREREGINKAGKGGKGLIIQEFVGPVRKFNLGLRYMEATSGL